MKLVKPVFAPAVSAACLVAVSLLSACLLSSCGAPGVPRSLARGPKAILVGPISEPIFQSQLLRAESGDLTAIDIVIAYYYNNDMVDKATVWEHRRAITEKTGKFRGRWRAYRP